MASVPNLLALLNLEPKRSCSPFGGQHRTILIAKDYSNAGDFVFSSLLQHFGRREQNNHILLVTMSHDWSNYSASSAKCGFSMRRSENGGNIDVLNVMEKFLEVMQSGDSTLDFCNYIQEGVINFIEKHSEALTVMIDDLSILLTIDSQPNEIYRLITAIDKKLRTRSEQLHPDCVSNLIIQTMFTNIKPNEKDKPNYNRLNQMISNLGNICDICITLKPLDTGHSTRVDGTIKIVDNRLMASPTTSAIQPKQTLTNSIFPEFSGDIGTTKAYFFKLGDRRVRLTSTALIF